MTVGSRMRKTYLAQVLYKNDSCYQFVSENFVKEHPDLKFIEVFEDAICTKDDVEVGISD